MRATAFDPVQSRFLPPPFHQPAADRQGPAGKTGPVAYIPHPPDFPIRVREQPPSAEGREPFHAGSRLGLSYSSERFMRPGTLVELQIEVCGKTGRFRGEVIRVRETGFRYEIGVWLESDADAARARIVEQVCHIECYLNKKRREGCRVSRQRAAQEWIAKFAASFPVF